MTEDAAVRGVERFDLRLAGGTVLVGGAGLCAVDVLVTGGRIAALCEPGTAVDAAEVVEVRGLTVLPGAIDAHVHLGQDITYPRDDEDTAAETAAAAAGGVTTVLAYLMTPEPYDEVHPGVVARMERSAQVDFGFHFCIVTEEQLGRIPGYAEELGVSSFKFFMNFRGEEGRYLGLPGNDDGFLYDLLRTAAASGTMIDPHAENIEIVWRLRQQAAGAGQPPLQAWNAVRPPLVEAEAEQRAAYLAGATGASMYAVHVSSQAALQVLVDARRRHPPVFLETCPHYLTHDADSPLGLRGKVNPPLRQAADREALWAALAEGVIDVVGSDHVPRHHSKKTGDIWSASAGFPGLQTLLPVLLSEGHRRRGIPLDRVVDTVTARPARLFGLHPRKGTVAVGADADLAVVDLQASSVVDADSQVSAAGYSIYEGWELGCKVVHTIVRGAFAWRDGQLLPGARGRFLPRPHSGAAALAGVGR